MRRSTRARERIGYMPEERELYPKMRARDQLEYLGVLHGLAHRRARAAATEWLERLGLGNRAGARVEQLSQGNQERVQLAAALVHRPDVLVLDEPFAGLDLIVCDLLSEVLREQAARGVPVLFSHQLELVEHICESVAIIDRGRRQRPARDLQGRPARDRGALALARVEPNGTCAQIAAFLPPFAPMVVPTRVVLGDMGGIAQSRSNCSRPSS